MLKQIHTCLLLLKTGTVAFVLGRNFFPSVRPMGKSPRPKDHMQETTMACLLLLKTGTVAFVPGRTFFPLGPAPGKILTSPKPYAENEEGLFAVAENRHVWVYSAAYLFPTSVRPLIKNVDKCVSICLFAVVENRQASVCGIQKNLPAPVVETR